ncbi:MAG: redoxin domain-containing protein [Myxococcales bacterium]|nr:redoxin domain-containing protein [Myxococcales bacterium]
MSRTTLLALAAFASLPLAVACGDESATPSDGGSGGGDSPTTTTGDTSSSTGGTGGEGGMNNPPPLMRDNILGDVTWTVTFDEVAKAAGATDCTYTRHYEGVEDNSAKWFCPDCEVIFKSTVEMTEGLEDCFSQVSPDLAPLEEEWIGYGNGTYYRGTGIRMAEQGTIALDGTMGTVTHAVTMLEAPVGGTMEFAIAGAFTMGTEEGDPMNGFTPPATYTCGWPKADPPAYTGDYTVVVGQQMPDGLFKDKCDETVRLHDLKGAYLIVEMGARDCPPCQAMAGDEEAFIADMAAQGITVYVVTLLAPSLSNPLGETTKNMLDTWTNNYDLTSPVLADRGWGLTMFIDVFGDTVGYPSMAIVDPDLNVLEVQNGFGSFAEIEALITADAQ